MNTQTLTALETPDLNIGKPARLGWIALLVLVGFLGTWAAFSVISGAVIASGQAVVHGKPKEIQSLDGGVVAELHVRDGDIVAAGDSLMRLDPTVLEVNLDIARGQLAAALALRARLRAEQAQTETLSFDYSDVPFGALDVGRHEQGQREIFAARAAVLEGQRAQLDAAKEQFDTQAKGINGQIAALEDQIVLLDNDLVNMRELASKGLTRQSQMTEIQRSKSQLVGQLAALEAERAQLGNARRESELSVLQAERSFLEDVVTELREVSGSVEELTLQIVTHEAQLSRIDILAPSAGIVHQLQVTTLGGVVVPGETIAQIVPLDQGMDFELRVDPRNIDQVHPGQVARIVISSFDPQTTPQLDARVASVSPGVITDPNTGQAFYQVSIAIPPEELAQLGDAKLMPGMPVEAYLETGDRSVLSYLLHPMTAHLRRALRG